MFGCIESIELTQEVKTVIMDKLTKLSPYQKELELLKNNF